MFSCWSVSKLRGLCRKLSPVHVSYVFIQYCLVPIDPNTVFMGVLIFCGTRNVSQPSASVSSDGDLLETRRILQFARWRWRASEGTLWCTSKCVARRLWSYRRHDIIWQLDFYSSCAAQTHQPCSESLPAGHRSQPKRMKTLRFSRTCGHSQLSCTCIYPFYICIFYINFHNPVKNLCHNSSLFVVFKLYSLVHGWRIFMFTFHTIWTVLFLFVCFVLVGLEKTKHNGQRWDLPLSSCASPQGRGILGPAALHWCFTLTV